MAVKPVPIPVPEDPVTPPPDNKVVYPPEAPIINPISFINRKFSGEAKYTPYFNNQNSKTFKKSPFSIIIEYGANKEFSKTITNVMLRNVGQEVDATGNPIYDIYEFVAQDILENDNEFTK